MDLAPGRRVAGGALFIVGAVRPAATWPVFSRDCGGIAALRLLFAGRDADFQGVGIAGRLDGHSCLDLSIMSYIDPASAAEGRTDALFAAVG